jgi:signal transduction histidine kinase
VIDNVENEPYFLNLPVTAEVGLRSYIGVPIFYNNGVQYGTLCAIDPAPQKLERRDEYVEMLQIFARIVMFQIEREEMLAAMEESCQQRNRVHSMITHELRSPLNNILGFSQMIQEGYYGEVVQAQVEALERIIRGGRTMLHLINDLLDLAKAEAGHFELNIERHSLPYQLATITQGIEPQARQQDAQIEVDFSGTKLTEFDTDELRFQQIMLNLLANALKFSSHGTVTVKVSEATIEEGVVKLYSDVPTFADLPFVFSRGGKAEQLFKSGGLTPQDLPPLADGRWLTISVNDTGCGIPVAQLPTVFEEFQQIRVEGTRQAHGTGLGLTIVSRLVAALGGGIAVRSQPGSGSSFTLFFRL